MRCYNCQMARSAKRVRVYVADDHPVYREGLVRAIRERPDLELVGEASDGREGLPQIKALEAGVAGPAGGARRGAPAADQVARAGRGGARRADTGPRRNGGPERDQARGPPHARGLSV